MRTSILVGGLILASFAFATTAQAHDPQRRPAGFGNGAHDLAPHWHKSYTPFGTYIWYGNGRHDLRPHHHSVSPFGGVRSYSVTPFGFTRSYNGFPGYSPFPRTYGYRGVPYGYRGFGW